MRWRPYFKGSMVKCIGILPGPFTHCVSWSKAPHFFGLHFLSQYHRHHDSSFCRITPGHSRKLVSWNSNMYLLIPQTLILSLRHAVSRRFPRKTEYSLCCWTTTASYVQSVEELLDSLTFDGGTWVNQGCMQSTAAALHLKDFLWPK